MKIALTSLCAVLLLALLIAVILYGAARAQLLPFTPEVQKSKGDGSFVQLSHGLVHYKLEGARPPATAPRRAANKKPLIVLIHGLSTPSFVWQGVVPSLVGAGYQVLRYDLYGRGWSARPDAKHNAALYYEQLKELLAALDVKGEIILVGYSMGGAIATHFAARESVAALALIAPAGLDVNQAGTRLLSSVLLGDWLMAVRGKQQILEIYKLAENQGVAVPNILALYQEQVSYEGYLDALLSTLRHFPLVGLEGAYKRVGEKKTPTLVVLGGNDSVIYASSLDKINQLIPHRKAAVHPQATHAITYSEPQFVSDALLDFFKSL